MKCRVCKLDKSAEELVPLEPRYRTQRCFACRTKAQRRTDARPRAKQLRRAGCLRRRYGLTTGQFETMLVKQNGVCAICRRRAGPESGGMLHVDHCHHSGKVRGLLCIKCNTAIGKLDDNPALLITAAQYLTPP